MPQIGENHGYIQPLSAGNHLLRRRPVDLSHPEMVYFNDIIHRRTECQRINHLLSPFPSHLPRTSAFMISL